MFLHVLGLVRLGQSRTLGAMPKLPKPLPPVILLETELRIVGISGKLLFFLITLLCTLKLRSQV